jgi:hypothetical protein
MAIIMGRMRIIANMIVKLSFLIELLVMIELKWMRNLWMTTIKVNVIKLFITAINKLCSKKLLIVSKYCYFFHTFCFYRAISNIFIVLKGSTSRITK